VRLAVRDDQGYSLMVTMMMMVVIGGFVAAMWSTLLPVYQHVMSLRYRDTLRALNEGAMDTLVGKINDALYTPPAAVNGTAVISATNTVGAAKFATTETITNLGAGGLGTGGPPQNSILYSKINPASYTFYSLTSTASNAAVNKQISVLLAAVPPGGNSNGASFLQPWQMGAAFGMNTVNEVGLACVNGYNLPAGWTNPYQFGDTTVEKGITWQIGTGATNRSQVIAGNQFEFWHPGDNPPALPPGTIPLQYENFTQIMGNLYSNFQDQQGADGNGYWARNQSNDYNGAPNIAALQGDSTNANVFGTYNGMTLNGQGVPSGYQAGSNNSSVQIPAYTPSTTGNPSAISSINPAWGYNGDPNVSGHSATLPAAGTTDGGAAYQSSPYTGGYLVSPGAGQAGTADTWNFPAPPTPVAPGAPVGAGAPATGGLGVPNNTGTYFASTPQNVVINGGTLNITSSATAPPTSLSVGSGQTINIPPGNYSLSSLQVVNGGKITIDPNVQGQTQFFVNPSGTGQGTAGSVYVDNTSSINMTGISGGNGFTTAGQSGFGASLPAGQSTVNTASPITETSGSCMNLAICTNSYCNMLFAGNTRAIVNAPQAEVNVGYQPYYGCQYTPNSTTEPSNVMANDANFYGSIVAADVSVVSDYWSGAGAYLHYDTKLRTINFSNPQAPIYNQPLTFYDPWMYGSPAAPPPPSQWRAVTWQEQLGAW
jgi:hypothetical protein